LLPVRQPRGKCGFIQTCRPVVNAGENHGRDHTGTTPAGRSATSTAGKAAWLLGTARLVGVEDYSAKYKGEQVEVALFGGDYQDGVLTAYCSIDDVAHVELNGHILIPLQNIASLHCSSRCDAPEPDWPPRGLAEDERDEEP